MFSAWGAFIYRFRRPVALLAIIVAIASGSLASKVTGSLSAGGWTDPGSESSAVTKRLADDFGAHGAETRNTHFQGCDHDEIKPMCEAASVASGASGAWRVE